MKILLSSHFFHPSIGGIEEVSRVLAHEFVEFGHEVRVVTSTRSKDGTKFPFPIYRSPSPRELLRLTRWCDVFFHNNISLRTAWPLLFIPRPWVVAHHTWISRIKGGIGWRDRLKQFVARNARNISVSRAMSEHILAPTVVIGNPYRDGLFRRNDSIGPERELIFLGRLVWDKGLDLLFEALAILQHQGLRPRLTVVGTGSEETRLHQQVASLGLDEQVTFAGLKTGEDLVTLLNQHRVLVAPSRWQEPFGLIALEGIACGCVALGAHCGGLPDAIGPCGVTFPHGDIPALARSIADLLAPGADLEKFRAAASGHLAKHSARAVAAQYLKVLEEAVGA